jgi:hypothetical protein
MVKKFVAATFREWCAVGGFSGGGERGAEWKPVTERLRGGVGSSTKDMGALASGLPRVVTDDLATGFLANCGNNR